MGGDELFHPDHVVPGAEFVAALVENPHRLVAQFFVKAHAVVVQVIIRSFGAGDAGIEIRLQCGVSTKQEYV